MKKVLAVASGGGHWNQLMQITPAFENCKVTYATTIDGLAKQFAIENSFLIADANRNEKLKLVFSVFNALKIMFKVRPHVVISTGAAPGFMFICLGRVFGAKTIWLDSIANGEELSMCGKLSTKVAHITLTQWQHLSDGKKVLYQGAVV